jgi:hypothetical protein
MSDRYVEEAQKNMNALERVLKGLPGISGYTDRELRREADKRLRDLIANQLDEQKKSLLELQKRLLGSGGLAWLDDIDGAIQKLQLLIDRIRTASQGYAGLFDAVRIREPQLKALNDFDVALAGRVVVVQDSVKALADGLANKADLQPLIQKLGDLISDLNSTFSKRQEAVVSPDLLTNPGFAPEVNPPSA